MIDYLTPLFQRLPVMQLEIPITPAVKGAVGYFFHWQETMPYFTNRVANHQGEWIDEDQRRETYTIAMRFVVGHLTEGTYGTPEMNVHSQEPLIQQYFANHIGLTDDGNVYTTYLDYLDPQNVNFLGSNGFHVFPGGGLPVQQVGTEFLLEVPFIIPVTQSKWR